MKTEHITDKRRYRRERKGDGGRDGGGEQREVTNLEEASPLRLYGKKIFREMSFLFFFIFIWEMRKVDHQFLQKFFSVHSKFHYFPIRSIILGEKYILLYAYECNSLNSRFLCTAQPIRHLTLIVSACPKNSVSRGSNLVELSNSFPIRIRDSYENLIRNLTQ